jgi:hypothetical protein
MRSEEGAVWLDRLSTAVGKRVYCAADYMGRPRRLLEAQRVKLYADMPVPEGWHEEYAKGRVNPDRYLNEVHDYGTQPDVATNWKESTHP